MEPVDRTATAGRLVEIEDWILAALARRIDVPAASIERDLELDAYGLDSVEAVILGAELAEWVGVDVDPAIVIEHPTVNSLSRALCQFLETNPPPISR